MTGWRQKRCLVVLVTATTAEPHRSAQPELPAEPLAALAHSAPLL